jgi:RNA polymerase sigma-70 factor (ECF subfamily)
VDPDRALEEDLLDRIRRDAPGAFDAFVERFGDRIFAFGMRMCGEREDARDVFQDTLIQAYRSLRDLREPRALRSWIYRVAANACLMKRRRGKFEPEREISLDELIPRSREDAEAEIPDPAALPDEEVRRGEVQRAVRAALDAIPEHYRIVLALRDMEQLTTQEVMEALGLPESTVKMRLHRARIMVRNRLKDALA